MNLLSKMFAIKINNTKYDLVQINKIVTSKS